MKNIKILFSYIAKLKWAMAFIMLLSIVHILLELGMTGFQKFIIDDVFMKKQYGLIWIYITIFLGIIAAHFYLFIYINHFIRKMENSMKASLFQDMLSRIQQFPVIKLQQERTAKLVEHLTNDISTMTRIVVRDLPFMRFQGILKAIILSVVIAMASPTIFFINLLAALLFFGVGKWMSPKQEAVGKEVTESGTDLKVCTEEAISSTCEILAFHRQDWEMDKFANYYSKYLGAVKRRLRLGRMQSYLTEPILWGIQLIVIAYGGYRVMQGAMTLGSFVVVFHFSSELIWAYFWQLGGILGFKGQLAVVERVRSILEAESVEDGKQHLQETIHDMAIRNVTFTYPGLDTPILQQFTMNIPLGKTIAIVGKSGGGKSTIAQILMRSFLPDEGQIDLNGKSLQDIRRLDWLARISIVFQDAYLFPESILTNLLMGSSHTQEEIEHICRLMQIDETIKSFPDGYQTEIGERGIQLSGGQRQRVVLSRALLRNTDILILDEATSALDYETERQVYQNLQSLRKGKTTIIIAHRLSTVQDADIIYVVDHGRVVEQGTHLELMKRGEGYVKLVAAGE